MESAAVVTHFKNPVSVPPLDGTKNSEERAVGVMDKINAKAKETLTTTKGTMLLVGLIPAFLTVILSYGSSVVGWVRNDQTQIEKQIELQKSIDMILKNQEAMSQQQQDLNKRLTQMEIQSAKVEGFKLGVNSK